MTSRPMIPVTVLVPLAEYQRLAEAAELRGHDTIGEWLLALALDLRSMPTGSFPPEHLAHLVRAGLCDADIAAATGLSNNEIASRRRRLGLPANRRYRRTPR